MIQIQVFSLKELDKFVKKNYHNIYCLTDVKDFQAPEEALRTSTIYTQLWTYFILPGFRLCAKSTSLA
jgi:hypothetical protein